MSSTLTPEELATEWQFKKYSTGNLEAAIDLLVTWRNWDFEPGDTFMIRFFSGGEEAREVVTASKTQVKCVGSGEIAHPSHYRAVGYDFKHPDEYHVLVAVKASTRQSAEAQVRDFTRATGYGDAVKGSRLVRAGTVEPLIVVGGLARQWQNENVHLNDLRAALKLLQEWRSWKFKPGDTFVVPTTTTSVDPRTVQAAIGVNPRLVTVKSKEGGSFEYGADEYRQIGAQFKRGITHFTVQFEVPGTDFDNAKDNVRKAFKEIGLEVRVR